MVQILAAVAMCPFLYDFEHVNMNFASVVPQSWVMEHFHAIIHDLLYRYIWVVPSVNDTRGNVLQYSYCDQASRFV
jgi:hypothetical protein